MLFKTPTADAETKKRSLYVFPLWGAVNRHIEGRNGRPASIMWDAMDKRPRGEVALTRRC
jgi:hypothetical protein